MKTLQEKQEPDEATPEDDEGNSAISGDAPYVMEGEEEEVDLDGAMEDLDENEEEEEDPSPMFTHDKAVGTGDKQITPKIHHLWLHSHSVRIGNRRLEVS